MSVCTPKSFDLTGKVALITGASYGIGFAIATAMANCGAKIVFNDIKQELVDKGLAAYKEAGIEAHGYVCDVTNEDAVNEMVKKITAEVGHINVLVNNAGVALFGLFAGLKLPNLTWTNEITPIKQGGSVMLALFGGFVYAGLLPLAYFLGASALGLSACLGIYLGLTLALAAVLYVWLRRRGAAVFAAL